MSVFATPTRAAATRSNERSCLRQRRGLQGCVGILLVLHLANPLFAEPERVLRLTFTPHVTLSYSTLRETYNIPDTTYIGMPALLSDGSGIVFSAGRRLFHVPLPFDHANDGPVTVSDAPSHIMDIAPGPGRRVALACLNGEIAICDPTRGGAAEAIAQLDEQQLRIAWHEEANLIAFSGERAAHIYNSKKHQVTRVYTRQAPAEDAVVEVLFFPDGRSIACMTVRGLVVVDLEGGRTTAFPAVKSRLVSKLAIHPNGKTIAFQGWDDQRDAEGNITNSLQLFELSARKVVATLSLGTRLATQVVYHPSGAVLVIAGNHLREEPGDRTLRFFSTESGFKEIDGDVSYLSYGVVGFSKDGKLCFSHTGTECRIAYCELVQTDEE